MFGRIPHPPRSTTNYNYMQIETKKGLWVSTSFTKRFGNKDITPAKTVPAFKVLPRDMYDQEIKSEFIVQECTLEDVVAFLENPPKGCNNGYWNIFYVAGCVVDVGWDSDDRKWSVDAWNLDGGHWLAGDRAFGCNSRLEPLASDTLTLEHLAARVQKLEDIITHHNLGV